MLIQITEPGQHEGDSAPCHLFMPEVEWRQPLGPVFRPERCQLDDDDEWPAELLQAQPSRGAVTTTFHDDKPGPGPGRDWFGVIVFTCWMAYIGLMAVLMLRPPMP